LRYKLLGKTGLRVSELCLGGMTFGQDWGTMLAGASKEESKKIFNHFVEAGGNFIDTANVYQNGSSEKYIGEFIAAEREKFILATKYTLSTNPDDPNASGSHRKNLVHAVNASLKRLGTSFLDLLWVHVWDAMTPVEELMRSLDDLVRSEKVLYVGISDAPAWFISQANTLAELRGWSPFISIQIMYNLVERTPERELLPMAKALDIGVAVWSPLAGGILSGKYSKQRSIDEAKRFDPGNPMSAEFVNERNLSIANKVQSIAKEMGRTPSQVALNWIRQQKDRGVLIPIIGARTEAQVRENLGCLDFELSADYMRALDEISRIQLGFPHDLIESEFGKMMAYGNKFPFIDNHRKDIIIH
jgi:aryl-alcohol dehydrogenase-like predicted oxidoreductase